MKSTTFNNDFKCVPFCDPPELYADGAALGQNSSICTDDPGLAWLLPFESLPYLQHACISFQDPLNLNKSSVQVSSVANLPISNVDGSGSFDPPRTSRYALLSCAENGTLNLYEVVHDIFVAHKVSG